MQSSLHSQDSSYALSIGEQDKQRLIILNEVQNPFSLDKLQISPGARILIIGCGIGLLEMEMAKQGGYVLGTDLSLEQIELAKSLCNVENIEFRQLNAVDVDQIDGLFDRIHCRYVLTHLPLETISKILPVLCSKLAPGGILLMEEIFSNTSLFCEPPHPGYDLWKEVVDKQFSLQHADNSPGLHILRFLEERNYPVSYSIYQPILSTPREKQLLSLGIKSVAPKLIQKNIYSSEEIEEILKQLYSLEDDSCTLPK